MYSNKQKISSQADPIKWEAMKQIAKEEGRNIDGLLDEALTDYLQKKQGDLPRKSVMQAYESSHDKYKELYKLLAK